MKEDEEGGGGEMAVVYVLRCSEVYNTPWETINIEHIYSRYNSIIRLQRG